MSFNKCFVPGCTTGCNVGSKSNKIVPENIRTLFKTPNTKALFEKWKRNIPRGGVELLPGCLVCEIHFPEGSVSRYMKTSMVDGTVCLVKRSKPILKPNAVPTIFPNLPPHLYRTLKRVAPPPNVNIVPKTQKTSSSETFDSTCSSKRSFESILNLPGCQKNRISDDMIHVSEVSSSINDAVIKTADMSKPVTEGNVSSTQDSLPQKYSSSSLNRSIELPIAKSTLDLSYQNDNFDCKSNDLSAISSKNIFPHETIHKQKSFDLTKYSPPDTTDKFQIIIAEGDDCDSLNNNDILTFRYLKENIEDVKVPSWRWSCSFLRNSIAFLDWTPNFDIRKKIIIHYDMKYKTFIMGKEICIKGFEGPKSFQDLQTFLQIVDKIVVCQGIERGKAKQWSKDCYGFVPPREEGKKKGIKRQCDECLQHKKNIPIVQKMHEEKQQALQLSAALRTERMRNRRLALMIQKLRQKIETESSQCIVSDDLNQLRGNKTEEEILVNVIHDEETNEAVEESIVNIDDEMFIT